MSAARPDPPITADAEIAELVRLFESCQLTGERWTHRAHVAVAASYLRCYPLPEATDRARTHIRKYNASRGNYTGYHETITVLFLCLVARELVSHSRSLVELVNGLADRYPVAWLSGYYSKDRLWLAEARDGFVAPDLRPVDF